MSYGHRQQKGVDKMEKLLDSVKNVYGKCKDWVLKKTEHVNWKEVWDKITTGILILLMASPVLILLYIFLWFVMR